MTRIADLLASGKTYSFEFAPPRTPEQEARLAKVLVELEPLRPSFVSVTYGAGGSTREKTREIVERIHRDTSMTPMPHLTCVAHTHAEVVEIVTGYRDAGLHNLLALGGDPPLENETVSSDFAYASELVTMARHIGDFSIGVAAFPEGHPRSPDLATDRRFLAAKLEEADFGITQFFFTADHYFGMVDDLAALGIDKPVLPGVMAFVNIEGTYRMAAMNGTEVPAWLGERMDRVAGDPPAIRALAVETATTLCQELLDGGAPGIHLYTMNFSRAAKEIWENLGLTG